MSVTCNICAEKVNSVVRAEITCDYCNFSACKSCWKHFLLSVIQDAHCMSCKRSWDRTTLVNKLGNFVNKEYKTHREEVLLDRERGHLPATQPYVEVEIQVERINKELLLIRNEIKSLRGKLLEQNYLNNFLLIRKEIKTLKEKYFALQHLKKYEMNREKENKQFVRKCPSQHCKGFLSTQWKCELCENYTCSACNEIKGKTRKDHTCDPNNVETTKLLANDTKPCPGCGTGIFKLEGCDQMFCVQCKTPWSWKTGKIETGNIHNPHYFEFMRRNGNLDRQIGEVRCGRELDHRYVYRLNKRIKTSNLRHTIRSILHIKEVDLPRYTVHAVDDNLQLRISYMMGKISEEQFKVKLQKLEKDRQKKREISHILDMFVNCATDIIYRYASVQENNEETLTNELDVLRLYANEYLSGIANVYKCKNLCINQSFECK